MIQLWEVLGKTCSEEGYIGKLLGNGNQPISSSRGEHDLTFQDRLKDRLGMPHLSRAELTELFRLLKSKVFLQLAETLGGIVRGQLQAAQVAQPSSQFLQALGLSTIDTTFRADVTANGAQLNTRYKFTLPGSELSALNGVLHDPAAAHTYHILHFHWSPPDCICGLSFSPGYEHPLEGGTRDVPAGLDAPQAVLNELAGGSHVAGPHTVSPHGASGHSSTLPQSRQS